MAYRFLRYPNGMKKAVTFSYDDGSFHDLRLAEVCDRYGIKCTFNICRALDTEQTERMTAAQIETHLLQKGHEVAVHGFDHTSPVHCTDIEIINDVLNCRKELETRFQRIIRGMAYPDLPIELAGEARCREIKALLQSMGIVYSRTLGKDNRYFALPRDWYAWMPTAHHDNPDVMHYIKEFVGTDYQKQYHSNHDAKLFYLWGHSFEFEYNDNWEHLEEICAALGGHEEIWYATNIEIYDYVTAYRSLQWNATGDRVYNPTARTVWFAIEQAEYCIRPGETLTI